MLKDEFCINFSGELKTQERPDPLSTLLLPLKRSQKHFAFAISPNLPKIFSHFQALSYLEYSLTCVKEEEDGSKNDLLGH